MSPRSRARLFFAITLLLAAVFVRLGLWQVTRLNERRTANQLALAARSAVAVDLDRHPSPNHQTLQNRRIRLRGEYDLANQVVLRGQSAGGVPGVRIVTPLRPANGDSAVLVQRGFVPSPDASGVDLTSVDEAGTVWVEATGFLLPDTAVAGEPREAKGQTTWRRIDLAEVRRRLPYPVSSLLALQLPDSALPALPRRDPPAILDDGPHLSYAVQWFSFAVTALVIGGIIGFRVKEAGERSR